MKIRLLLFTLSTMMILQETTKAQNSGRIIYEQKTKLNIDFNSDNEEMIKNMPKEQVNNKELLFDSTASLFHSSKKSNKDQEIQSENEHGKMVIKMNQPDDQIYCDLIEKKRIEQRDFMSRKFLIEIPFSSSTWKLTGNQKTILDYPCQEAIMQDTTRKVKAWFTSAIPLSTGPNGVCNLPGLVLAAEFMGGDMTFEAKHIDLQPIDHKLIVRPTKGEKMTRDEFNKMVMEKNKEMDEQGDGNGNVIIRIKK